MKKNQLNGLKKLSKMLPKSMEIQKYSILIKGYEMSMDEIEKVSFNVEAEKYYVKSGNYRVIEINHFNRLKKAFARNKEKGLIDYIGWVDKNNLKMNELFEKMELQRVSEDILNIANKGEKGFWSNLLNFLFAFLAVFKNKAA